jgi:D-glycero-alpha-D-manno-heptose-7-phosphate kinase
MLIRSRAPVRIDLAGGWTDVPPFADREGGAVVNMTLNRYTYATLRTHSGAGVRIQSADYNTYVEAETVRRLEYDGTLDLVKAALKRLDIKSGLELTTRADAPPGSGLGTSASLGVALVGVLNVLQAERLSAHEVAELATSLEIEELGIAGGKQDQLAAALGGINFLEFGPYRPVSSPLPLSSGVINELEKRLVLCYSGTSRLSGDIIQRVQQAYTSGEAATCNALRSMREISRRVKSALLAGTLNELGPLLRENWSCQRALHPSVTNETVDRLFMIAERHGALGGKACGAGGGGCIVFFCEADAERSVREALAQAGGQIIDFNLDRHGLQTWRIDEGTGRVL